MAIEKVREAIRIKLEELYEVDSEYQQALSKIVIPFSVIFKKPRSSEFSSLEEDLPISKRDKEFKKILLKEL